VKVQEVVSPTSNPSMQLYISLFAWHESVNVLPAVGDAGDNVGVPTPVFTALGTDVLELEDMDDVGDVVDVEVEVVVVVDTVVDVVDFDVVEVDFTVVDAVEEVDALVDADVDALVLAVVVLEEPPPLPCIAFV
jgi:hypothetical protein